MKRAVSLAFATLSVTACMFRSPNNELDRYVGGPVSAVAATLGPPTVKFDLANGRRAFDWENYGGCTYSVTATTGNSGSASLADWKVESWQQTDACRDVER